MSNKKWLLLISFSLIVLGIAYLNFTQESKQLITANTPSLDSAGVFKIQKDVPRMLILATDLDIPWGLVFLPASPQGGPDESILFTERPGRVRIINNKGILNPTPAAILKDALVQGEGGLLGITIHPDFTNNHFVYLYYTYSNLNHNTLNRVVRFEFENNKLQNEKIIVNNIPGSSNHNGGRIKFGPDGFLYISTGDAQEPSLAQNINSLAGKILRVTDDGKPAPGNPFNNVIFSYGHRNPQGLTWDENGNLWETEHGSSAFDEINIIKKGKNYGWPARLASESVAGRPVIQGNKTQNNMEIPVLNSGSDTWAPSGTAYFNGSIFFAGLRGQALYEYKIENKTLITHLKNEVGRIREVVVGPDNLLYITTNNRDGRGIPDSTDDKIIRVNPAKL